MNSESKKLIQRQLKHSGIDPESDQFDKQAFQEFIEKVEAQYEKYQSKIHTIESLTEESGQENRIAPHLALPASAQDTGTLVARQLSLEGSPFTKKLYSFLGISRQNFLSDSDYMTASTTGILLLCYVPAWAFYILFYLVGQNLPALLSCSLGLVSSVISLVLIKWKGLFKIGYYFAHIFGVLALYFVSMFTGGIHSPIYSWIFFTVVAAFLCGGSRLGVFVTILSCGIFVLAYATSAFFVKFQVPDIFTFGTEQYPIFIAMTHIASLILLSVVTEIFHNRQRRAYNTIKDYSDRLLAQSSVLEMQKKTLEDHKLQMIKQQNKLLEANRKLQDLDKQKTHFFQMVSHELRTPLTLIIHPLDSLKSKYPQDENIDICARNSRRLLRLVNQLLDFQKVRSKTLDLEVLSLSADNFAHGIHQSFRPLCVEKGIDLKLHFEDKNLSIKGQVDALEKVLFNLLSNAWKHTPSGGWIRLEVTRMINNVVRIGVKDSGPGISREQQKSLFKVFSQLDSKTNRTYEGSGLGLALCKELVEAMNGQIGIDTELGQGSLFWIELPEGSEEESSKEGADVSEVHLKIVNEVRLSKRENLASVSETSSSDQNQGAQIVIIDDIADMRHIIARKLQKWGYRTREFEDATQALNFVKQGSGIELVITDWMMPGMSGPELVKALRQNSSTSVIPVVMLTSKADERSKIEGVEFGANAYIGKPFDDLELKSTVDNLISLKSKEAQIESLNRNILQNILTRFMPPRFIADIIAGKRVFDETPQLRSITVLFCDLHEFTRKSEEMGAKKTAFVLNRYFSEMSKVIFHNSGLVDKYIGDGIMALFGAFDETDPVMQAEKSVQCSIEMQNKLTELNSELSAMGIPQFQMRIGINSGPAVVGSFGCESRSEYTAIGPAVNLASRIESAAGPGETLISTTVRDCLSTEIWEHAGAFEMKGVANQTILFRIRNSNKGEAKKAS